MTVKRVCKQKHNSYYWDDVEWGQIREELKECDSKLEKLEQENKEMERCLVRISLADTEKHDWYSNEASECLEKLAKGKEA